MAALFHNGVFCKLKTGLTGDGENDTAEIMQQTPRHSVQCGLQSSIQPIIA